MDSLYDVGVPQLPEVKKIGRDSVVLIANGDLRESANVRCWPVQQEFEKKLENILHERFQTKLIRMGKAEGGFISSQREGSDIFSQIDPDARIIVLITAWQYSHHVANALVLHRGPILLLANFDGTWPGLVGMLNMAGSLTALGRAYSRLWSETFDDAVFYTELENWLNNGSITWDRSYLKAYRSSAANSAAATFGVELGHYVLRRKELIGLFDIYCMGMINGVFPLKAMADIGMPIEGLSQSALVHEMSRVSEEEREQCLQFYLDGGMQFDFGSDPATELTRGQVLEQCAMLIAMVRFTERFGLTTVGVQYQQGLKDVCPASDFAEGAIGSSMRFPVRDEEGKIIRAGKPIPCANEVDMGSAIPQTMLFRLLDTLGFASETTLHDVRWGSEYQGCFYWDFLISGSVPFEHLRGGMAGARGYRQAPMYFALGGSTIGGQCKAGRFVWARAHYEGSDVHMHIGTGTAYELPQEELQRRLDATTSQWPMMNVTLDGIGRDELMAGHMSNHITVAYVPAEHVGFVCRALAEMATTMNMTVWIAGSAEME